MTFATVLLGALLVATVAPAVAQSDGPGIESDGPVVEKIKGKREKFGRTRVGDWIAIKDRTQDVRTTDGAIYADAEGFGDISRVLVSQGQTPRKLVTEWDRRYPIGTANTYRGLEAEITRRQRLIFLIVETLGSPPREGDPSVQLVVGATGANGKPLTAAAGIDLTNGRKQISRSGIFTGDQYGSGTTNQTGLTAGESAELYNGKSRDFGRFERKKNRMYHAAFVPPGTSHISIALETAQGGVQVVDELELPVGTTLLDLGDPYLGIVPEADPIICRDVRTRSTPPQLVDQPEFVDTTWLEASVEVSDDFDLSRLEGRSDEIELVPADGSGEAVRLPAVWEVDETLRTASVRVPLPAGVDSWRLDFTEAESDGAATEGGVRAFLQAERAGVGDLSPYLPFSKALEETVGSSSFDVRPTLGRFGGARGCARNDFVDTACDAAVAGGLASIVGLEPGGNVHSQLSTPDGFDVCVGSASGATTPSFIFARRDEPMTLDAFTSLVAASPCPSSPFGDSGTTMVLDCSADGFQSLWVHLTPSTDAASYIASLDVAVAPGDPVSAEDWGLVKAVFDALQDPLWRPETANRAATAVGDE